jgi:hypothetical protein
MNQKIVSALFGLVAGAAVLRGANAPNGGSAAGGGGAPPAATAPSATEKPAASGTPADAGQGDPKTATHSDQQEALRRYIKVYREFLDIHPPKAPTLQWTAHGSIGPQPVNLELAAKADDGADTTDTDLRELAAAAATDHRRLEFMIALVSDPVDSRLSSDFDLEMGAVQQALANSQYQFDRHWLPWAEPEEAEKKTYRQAAGVLLFRRDAVGPQEAPLLGVFLVGESPKIGVHKAAFESAVDFIVRLHNASTGDTAPVDIPVLGPVSSGSADSLAMAIRHVPGPTFDIVSGSATGGSVPTLLTAGAGLQGRVRFRRTVVPDAELAEVGLHFLHQQLGWDLRHAALLVENDTAYGRDVLFDHDAKRKELQKITKWSFPSGLFALRNAWEEKGGLTSPLMEASKSGSGRTVASPRTALDVSLLDKVAPVDVIPEIGPLTSRIDEMAISNLLRELANEKVAYVGILATDIRDELFLAEEVRRWAPNVTLFVLDSNLLYAHPQYNEVMFGTVVLSSFPLATEGGDVDISPSSPAHKLRRQFASEWQEGTFIAVQSLLNDPAVYGYSPRVWVSTSGNHSLLPLTWLKAMKNEPGIMQKRVNSVGPRPSAPILPASRSSRSSFNVRSLCLRTWETQLLVLVLAAGIISRLLFRLGRPIAKALPRTRWMFTLAVALLCLPAASIAGLVLTAILTDQSGADGRDNGEAFFLCIFFVTLLTAYADAARQLAKTSTTYERAAFVRILLLIVGWVAIPASTAILFSIWSFGHFSIFYHRVRAFNSGASPLVSLAWLAAALFTWLVLEMKRRLVWKRWTATFLFADCRIPSMPGSAPRKARISGLLGKAFANTGNPYPSCPYDCLLCAILPPVDTSGTGAYRRKSLPALVAAGLVGLLSLILLAQIQPAAESRGYGRCFVFLCGCVAALGMFSAVRFVDLWWRLRPVLRAIADTEVLAVLRRLSAEIDWKPLRFRHYEASFTILLRILERFRALDAFGATRQALAQALPIQAEEVMSLTAGAADGALDQEIESRQKLNELLADAYRTLSSSDASPAEEGVYALWIAAYLRQAVQQMRYFLMSATVSGTLVALAAATYGFQPKRFTMLVVWGVMAAVSAVTVTIFVQMDRDETLSAIGNTKAGEVTYDWHFFSNLLTYGVVPALGLVTSQFPSMGRFFDGLIDPLARLLGFS